jgi:arylsulfatase A-like enzyme
MNNKTSRRNFLRYAAGISAIGLVGTASCSKIQQKTGQSKKPNIVFILSDDQGWNDIGYHNPKIKTPHLDGLARTGVELDTHYVQPQCTPTRVALLTGRYPSRIGTHCTHASNDQAYPIGTMTMATMLKSLGYKTALSGKWHMGSKLEWGPKHHGFDHSYGSLAGAVGMYDHRYRPNSPYVKTWHRNHEFVEEKGHATDLVTDEAVKWIKTEHKAPFFLYVPYHSVHTPLVEEDKWLKMNSHFAEPDRRLYAAAVTHLDDCVGRIVKAIDDTGQRDNTLIVFISDNGAQVNHRGNTYPPPDPKLKNFSSNAPLRGEKCQAYEGGIRVPALVNFPARLKPGKVTAPMHIVDWMPTFANMLGLESTESLGWDGKDIWPIITSKIKNPPDRTIYTVWSSVWSSVWSWEAIRYGDFKIVRMKKKKTYRPWELYNLADDPNEDNNLAESNPQKLQELVNMFELEKKKDAK